MANNDRQSRVEPHVEEEGVEEVIRAPSTPDGAFIRPESCGGATFVGNVGVRNTNPFMDEMPFAEAEETPKGRTVVEEEVETIGVTRSNSGTSTAGANFTNAPPTIHISPSQKSASGCPQCSSGAACPHDFLTPTHSAPPPDYRAATASRRGRSPSFRELDFEEIEMLNERKRPIRKVPAILRALLVVLTVLLGGGLVILCLAFFAGAFNE